MNHTVKPIEDQAFLDGISNNDFAVLDKIYTLYLPKISTMILKNHGTKVEAKDIFQEAILVIFKKIKEPEFQLTTSFYNYLYSVSKFIWLRQLKKKHRSEVTLEGDEGYEFEASIESQIIEREKKQLFKRKFAQLGEDCRKVLQLFFDGTSLREIAQSLGYTDDYAKRKKYKCKEQLVKLIKADSLYGELI